jgi:alpha-tubulin suppressor-like RCC1 family protein
VAARIAVGQSYACLITSAGGAKCWGANNAGQLGNNGGNALTPADVVGLSSGVSAIAAGAEHTCAVVGGAAECWGFNGNGRLGNLSTPGSGSPIPVGVSGLSSGVTAIAAGTGHSCAVATSGAAQCWGYNGHGELGNNSTADSPIPVNVVGLSSGVTAITAGSLGAHTCALLGSGAQCWGLNQYGQLGNNSTNQSNVPVNVTGLLSGVVAIAAGDSHTCAVTTGGAAQCWGYNVYGELGNNSTANQLIPVGVTGLSSGVVAIAAGDGHTCALTSGGAVKCWGYNAAGQLGNNSTANSSVPVDVTGLSSGVVAIAAGGAESCAVTSNGRALCWGNDTSGQLGNNSVSNGSHVPVEVSGF